MPPVPDYHTGGFVFYKQTYFFKSIISRNCYARLCGGTTLLENLRFYSYYVIPTA
jgi:hypothetical protein